MARESGSIIGDRYVLARPADEDSSDVERWEAVDGVLRRSVIVAFAPPRTGADGEAAVDVDDDVTVLRGSAAVLDGGFHGDELYVVTPLGRPGGDDEDDETGAPVLRSITDLRPAGTGDPHPMTGAAGPTTAVVHDDATAPVSLSEFVSPDPTMPVDLRIVAGPAAGAATSAPARRRRLTGRQRTFARDADADPGTIAVPALASAATPSTSAESGSFTARSSVPGRRPSATAAGTGTVPEPPPAPVGGRRGSRPGTARAGLIGLVAAGLVGVSLAGMAALAGREPTVVGPPSAAEADVTPPVPTEPAPAPLEIPTTTAPVSAPSTTWSRPAPRAVPATTPPPASTPEDTPPTTVAPATTTPPPSTTTPPTTRPTATTMPSTPSTAKPSPSTPSTTEPTTGVGAATSQLDATKR